jgi:acetyltransferase-like isoleucine patch superfamily enzyme
MIKKIKKLCLFILNKNILYRHLSNKLKFPKIAIEPSALINVTGDFKYDSNCVLNVGSNIIIPAKATLELGKKCYIGRYVELGPTNKIEIGDHTSIQDRCIFVGDIEIGSYCLFSLNVLVTSGKHYFDRHPHLLIHDQDKMYQKELTIENRRESRVIIEDDCWIGMNVIIMPGVKIGKGSIIGANSVVTKNVPPYRVVAGAPATILRKRLEFNPPNKINYDKELDYPYFYSGIETSLFDRQISENGLLTKNKFQLALKTTNGKKIFLKVRSLFSSKLLKHNNSFCPVTEEFSNVSFDLIENAPNLLSFTCISKNSNTTLILQKAWIE